MNPRTSFYVQGLGNISPQCTFDNAEFLPEVSEYHENVLSCIPPDFKKYIHPVPLRRMSRMLRMGLSAAKICAQDANLEMPDAIITASGFGCIGDTTRFLHEIIDNGEKQLTPTFFTQSTYNSISGAIALDMKCNNYNTTYVHRGFAFETALQDAMMQLSDAPQKRILLGGFDETNVEQFVISQRTGILRSSNIPSLSLFSAEGDGTLQGEGACFVTLGTEKTANTYCRIRGLKMLYAPREAAELQHAMEALLRENHLQLSDIDVVVNGICGHAEQDALNHAVVKSSFENTQPVVFKHLIGEYCTTNAFALWLCSKIIREQRIPDVVMTKSISLSSFRHILLLNHFRGKNYSVLLLSAA